ncbi:MAG: hypothetical protein WDO19_14635 [Bacteroidota bacterium]
MKNEKAARKDIYYTNDHEWIDFRGAVAYVGICLFKLTGFKEIDEIRFSEPSGFKRKGELIATIHYREYQVEACMPVDGKILELNERLLTGDPGILLQQPESNGWIALINPAVPYERKELLLPKQYQMNGKSKYAKQ